MVRDDFLADLIAKMIAIPLLIGYSPKRWHKIVDVMLEKSPGDSRIHRLRIVALQESDFNQSNRLAIGRPVLHSLEDDKALPDMQYGSRPARQCIGAVLLKVLQWEIQRISKTTMAYIENDAIGCYDRIMNSLVILFLRKMGISRTILESLTQTWENKSHHIKTMYGISEQSYENSANNFLYGPGQGSTIGPILWLICFLLIY
jgi:hypothetical protein